MASKFCIGQRWISEAEPELGLGRIAGFDNRFVDIEFSALKQRRKYSAASAPLRRIVFRAGETIEDKSGRKHRIISVNENSSGFVEYVCEKETIGEDQLSDSTNISAPDKRLLAGITEKTEDFNSRFELLQQQAAIRQSGLRGFVGGRIDLIAHQLFIADCVSSRRNPRVLLSDETGLGKTIEACLIIHRFIMSGKALRVLILVPHTLVHQWFVELLRKFNLNFRIFTEEFGGDAKSGNPFIEEHQFICSIDLLLNNSAYRNAVLNAEWDLLVVDEAHHIRFNSPSFSLLKGLSDRTDGLLLLSATPEQFGRQDHFYRLQLLDPERYTNYQSYLQDVGRLQALSDYIDKWILDNKIDLDKTDPEAIQVTLPDQISSLLYGKDGSKKGAKTLTLAQLIDIYAVGRVQFRNTRRIIKGFPERNVQLISLQGNEKNLEAVKNEMLIELNKRSGHISIGADDPRLMAIVKLVQNLPDDKFLIICTTKQKTVDLQETLKKHVAADIAVFHEDMTLIQADRNAAWFAESTGARIMISSDIGSEGRNLQFCSHLILFDLPFNPELLEQRIGRLDRIGQKSVINLYVLFLNNSPQHILCKWYHEGVCSLQKNVPAAGAVFEELQEELGSLLLQSSDMPDFEQSVKSMILQTQKRCSQLTEELFSKRDRLLEFASFQPKRASELVNLIQYEDTHNRAENIMDKLFQHYGVAVEEAGENKQILLTEYVTDHAFPLPRQDRPTITYNRKTALFRDDIEFVTIDHPIVTGALDLYLSSEHGTSAYGFWLDNKKKEIVLECIFVMECIAAEYDSDRFLPPIPIRVAVNHTGKDVTLEYLPAKSSGLLKKGSIKPILSNQEISSVLIPSLLENANMIAGEMMKPVIEEALSKMLHFFESEKSRLDRLTELGAEISNEEYESLKKEALSLAGAIKNARLRLDSVCLIRRGPQ